MRKTFYCVVESFQGEIGIVSYMSKTMREEKSIAKSANKEVYLVTDNYSDAKMKASIVRTAKAKV